MKQVINSLPSDKVHVSNIHGDKDILIVKSRADGALVGVIMSTTSPPTRWEVKTNMPYYSAIIALAPTLPELITDLFEKGYTVHSLANP